MKIQALRVTNWQQLFENNRTREMKAMQWVPVPNSHDGEGYSTLMREKDGVALYGAWMLILQVASKCDARGVLAKDGRPYTAMSIATKTRAANDKIFKRAIELLLKPEISWLEWVEIEAKNQPELTFGASQVGAVKPQAAATPSQEGAKQSQEGADATAGGCAEEKEGMEEKRKREREQAFALLSSEPKFAGFRTEDWTEIVESARYAEVEKDGDVLAIVQEIIAAGRRRKTVREPAVWIMNGFAAWQKKEAPQKKHGPAADADDPVERIRRTFASGA